MKMFLPPILLSFISVANADEGTVRITMATSQGDIEIDLYKDKAPITVGNFLKLADGGHLDGGSFYRVVTYDNDNGTPKIEVIQGGRGDEESPFPTKRVRFRQSNTKPRSKPAYCTRTV
jgi:peptidyl-prolyl cis-trans isomerase A (cyclophilin A)